MVAHNMPLRHHALHQIAMVPNITANQKKSRRRLMLLQNVQNTAGAAIFKAGVKGQINNRLAAIAHIISAKLLQIILRRVAHRRFARLRETQTPVNRIAAGLHSLLFRPTRQKADQPQQQHKTNGGNSNFPATAARKFALI